jgi:integrase
MGKLTVKAIDSLVRGSIAGKTNDGDGLYFQISKAGSPSWIFRYKLDGKSREMGLGPYPTVTLAEARRLAADQRKVLAAGADPLAARDAEREAKREAERKAQARRITFETLATEYCSAHGSAWSEKWRKGWLRKLELYAFPHIGKLPAAEIQTEQVLRVLRPIWTAKTRTADEVRGQLEQILDAAKAHKLRDGDNPARWRGHLDSLLSKVEKKKARQRQHFRAMRWQDVPALMLKFAQSEARAAVAARLLILTGARSHMVRFAEWSEFDLAAGVWSLPAERMKMRQAFEIPLAPEVVELLNALPRIDGSPYLFPGQGKTGFMHANAVRNLLHGLGHEEITRHGFRSSFRDWANECTPYPREVCELALAHDERSQTEAAYSRSDFIEKRRALMADWARFCVTPQAANVIQIREARHGQTR